MITRPRASSDHVCVLPIGARVNVYWPNIIQGAKQGHWYLATVKKNSKQTGESLLHYDDGDKKWHLMGEETYEVISMNPIEKIGNKRKLDIIDALAIELKCSICLSIFDYPVTTDCLHTFCRPCLSAALRVKNNCPLCQKEILFRQVRANPELQNVIEIVKNATGEPGGASADDDKYPLKITHACTVPSPRPRIPVNCKKCGGKKWRRAAKCSGNCTVDASTEDTIGSSSTDSTAPQNPLVRAVPL